jgi:hypothetical protein
MRRSTSYCEEARPDFIVAAREDGLLLNHSRSLEKIEAQVIFW